MESDTKHRFFAVTPERILIGLLLVEGCLFLSDRYDWFWFNQRKNHTVLIAVAVVASALAATALWVGTSWAISRWTRKKPFQFGLRSVLLTVPVVAMVCGWLASAWNDARQQNQAAANLTGKGQGVSHFGVQDRFPNVPPKPLWGVIAPEFFHDIKGASARTDVDLEELLNFPAVQQLTCGGDLEFPNKGTEITDHGLDRLKNLTDLRELWVDSSKVTSAGVISLRGNTKLEVLHLARTQLDDSGMEVLRHFPNLRRLLIIPSNITDYHLWAYHHPVRFDDAELERFKLRSRLADRWRNPVNWQLLGTESDLVKEWGLKNSSPQRVTDAGLAHLSGLRELTLVDLCGLPIDGSGLQHLAASNGLQLLRLNECSITDEGLASLPTFPGLIQIELKSTLITDAGLEHLASQSALKSLDLDGTKVKGSGFRHFSKMMSLHGLSLASTNVDDDAMSHVSQIPSLTRINLRDTQISDTGLSHLGNMKGTTSLNLSATAVKGEGLVHFPQLTHLDLRENSLTDDAYLHIAKMDQLTDLYLDFTPTTDAHLATLGKLKNLLRLHLTGTKVTDAGLSHLKGMPKLIKIDLKGTKVTPTIVNDLMQTLPLGSRVDY